MTIRTIEALACGNKIITTNETIKEYDFYNPNNIWIIDRKSPYIDPEFILSPYEKIDERIINSYSIKKFVDCLVNRNPINHLRNKGEVEIENEVKKNL